MSVWKKGCCWGLLLLVLTTLSVAQQYDESNDFSFALKLYNEGFYDVAVKQWATFINRYPNSDRLADARYYYGDALYKINEFDNARIEFQALAVSYPGHSRAAQAWQMAGKSYEKTGKKEEAAKAYETVKLLFPAHALAPANLLAAGALYVELDQLTKAEQVLRDFLDRYLESSEYPRGRLLYGQLLLQKGQLEKADLEYQKVLGITEDKSIQAEATIGRALVYQRLGLLEKAVLNLQQVVEQHRGSSAAFKALKALAQLNLDRKDWQKALVLLKREGKNYDVARQRELQQCQIQALIMSEDYVLANQKSADWLKNSDALDKRPIRFYEAVSLLEQGQTDAAIARLKPLEKDFAGNNARADFRSAVLYNLTSAALKKRDLPSARLTLSQTTTAGWRGDLRRSFASGFDNTGISGRATCRRGRRTAALSRYLQQ